MEIERIEEKYYKRKLHRSITKDGTGGILAAS